MPLVSLKRRLRLSHTITPFLITRLNSIRYGDAKKLLDGFILQFLMSTYVKI